MATIFGSCQNETKSIYLAGWEAEFNGDQQCQSFIKTQAVNKLTSKKLWSSIELVFENNKLTKAFDYDEGKRSPRKLNQNELGLKYTPVEPNQIFEFIRTENSQSYLGGEKPNNFNIPRTEFIAPFIYFGKLSNQDEPFNWLPFDLNLVSPIYSNLNATFIDYSNPLQPQIINIDELKKAGNSYELELKNDSYLEFKKQHIKYQKINREPRRFAHSGIPNWIQYPEIPICPKSKNLMKFVIQINSDSGIEKSKSNIVGRKEFYQQYFDHLNFWGDGDIFIFFEPSSKVACYIIQNT